MTEFAPRYINPFKFKARHQGILILGAPHQSHNLPDHPKFNFLFEESEVSEAHLQALTPEERDLLVREHVIIDWKPDNSRLVDRQLGFFSLLQDDVHTPQQKLRNGRVAILGLGGLGSQVAFLLASSGVGHLTLCDYDTIERSNLNRQILYRESDIHRSKIETAAQALKAINAETQVTLLNGYLDTTAGIQEAVRGHDIVVRAVDQPAGVIFNIDAACRAEMIPHVGGGFLDTLVSAGPFCDASMPPLSDTQGSLRDLVIPQYSKGAVFGPLTFWVSSYVAGDVVRYLTGLTPPILKAKIYSLDGVTGKMFVQTL